MKALASPRWVTALAALVAAIIIALNVKLIADQIWPFLPSL
jgi:Mn2+/Fe2+ NRAMP family transporter